MMTHFDMRQLENMLRAGGTQRFHTWSAELIKTQDVAQHVYGLMWLVVALTRGTASRDLLLATLFHDGGERWVGDMPGPMKRLLPGLRDSLDTAEADALQARCGVAAPELSAFDSSTLDLADALDGVFYCSREVALGNRRIGAVFANYIDYASEAYKNVAFEYHNSLVEQVLEAASTQLAKEFRNGS